MAASEDTQKIVRRRFLEFFATLDMKYEPHSISRHVGITDFLLEIFKSEEGFWSRARQLQDLGDELLTRDELTSRLVSLLSSDPLYFLVLMHLHRQMKFTNIELVEMLFGRDRLNDVGYYQDLMKIDLGFARVVNSVSKPNRWSKYVGSVPLTGQNTLQSNSSEQSEKDNFVLATFKKAVSRYLGSQEDCWKLWEARIRVDSSVRKRIAGFVVNYEDFVLLLKEKAVLSALTRSLRIVNVEVEKQEKGKQGSKRLQEVLVGAGFIEKGIRVDIDKLTNELQLSSEYEYLSEVPWQAQNKKFDFVLVRNGKIGFVVETNYFTTSMSKIGEVVEHFKGLKKACRNKYRLLYVTDGIGWFNLMKKVTEMLQFEQEEMTIEPTEVPYLLNLEQFKREMNEIKKLM